MTTQATDADSGVNAVFNYTLQDYNANTTICDTYFQLSPAGVISVKQPIDVEIYTVLTCTLLATSTGGMVMKSITSIM